MRNSILVAQMETLKSSSGIYVRKKFPISNTDPLEFFYLKKKEAVSKVPFVVF
jgi:hypothetical protein